MTAVRKALARVAALDASATKGPWDHDDSGETISTVNGPDCIIADEVADDQGISSPENAAFIAESRDLLPRLAAALKVAVEAHDRIANQPPSANVSPAGISMAALAECERLAVEAP